MVTVRHAEDRGHANYGWLDTNHTFSFANYHDPEQMGFRALRVINEDRVEPGGGFGDHPHRDMEIISYVLGGQLEHKDSLGNGSVVRPGEIQRMSAGKGIVHSEYNPSDSEPLHFFQIWIEPWQTGLEPGYEQKTIDLEKSRGRLLLIAAPENFLTDFPAEFSVEFTKEREHAVRIHQDARLYAGWLAAGDEVTHELAADRHGWLQLAQGAVTFNGTPLKDSDGAAISNESTLVIRAERETELLLFDLA